jgi:hypothetical protein
MVGLAVGAWTITAGCGTNHPIGVTPPDGGGDRGSGGSTGSGGSGGGATGSGGSGGSAAGSGGSNGDAASGGSGGRGGTDGPPGDTPASADIHTGDGGRGVMTFFIPSFGNLARGGDQGGLEGADRTCQIYAARYGEGGRTWHAYLSTSASGGQPAVNARDRIGPGPWHNAKGVLVAASVNALHTPAMNMINAQTALDERGLAIASDTIAGHDVLTGSTAEGMAYPESDNATCKNWTSIGTDTRARIGHYDRMGAGADGTSFNSADFSATCMPGRAPQGVNNGMTYCFAIN